MPSIPDSLSAARRAGARRGFWSLGSLLRYLRRSETLLSVGLPVVVGAAAGLGGVAFRWMIEAFSRLFFDGGGRALAFLEGYYVILVPALGGLLVGPLVHFLAQEARGSGVPQVMLAVAAYRGRIRHRVAAVKALASSICIGSGGSVGREGPIVQIGSSMGSSLGQLLRLSDEGVRTLVASGAAAGISSTFNTPLAGVFFSLEVILGRFAPRALGLVVLSSVTGAAVSHVFLGDTPAFRASQYRLVSNWEFPLYMTLGVVAALVGYLFMVLRYRSEDAFDAVPVPPYLKPALGGLGVGALGYVYPQLFGFSYEPVDTALVGSMGMGLMAGLALAKIGATSLTLGSGGSGGVFAPSLFIGAMVGGSLGQAFHRLFPQITSPQGAYALVGMAALFAGVVRAPITAIIMVFEMTRDYSIILPLMAAVVVSTAVSRALMRESIYTMAVRRQGLHLEQGEDHDVLRDVLVRDVMTTDFPTVRPDLPVDRLRALFAETGHHGFPVVDRAGYLVGVVTVSDAIRARGRSGLTVGDIATRNVVVAYPDQSVHDALAQFGGHDVGRIPVVVPQGGKPKLVGVLRRHDIVRAYVRDMAHQETVHDARSPQEGPGPGG